jgi:hydroxymethylpyrimidine pyrophosphatase-like HAD family hydrolase
MANAPDDLKEVAATRGWIVGRRHDEDGVAEALEAALDGALDVPLVR